MEHAIKKQKVDADATSGSRLNELASTKVTSRCHTESSLD